MTYIEFLKSKQKAHAPSGFEPGPLNPAMMDFQRDITMWNIRKGKSAIFADTGLGKTLMQLVYASETYRHTGGNFLIVAPLAVGKQTVREGAKFGISAKYCRDQSEIEPGITVTNYEILSHFDVRSFVGVALDESSILKSYSGKTRNQLIEMFANTPYRLCCTATPSPNDYEELGNHAEFLGVMTRTEMLSTYFVHDGGDTAKWRLKGHAEADFWRWVASWAMMLKSPNDLGYDGSRYDLPPLNIVTHLAESPSSPYMFIPEAALTLAERRAARKESIDARVAIAADIAQGVERCLAWCDYNEESDKLKKAISGAVEVKGADSAEHKENAMLNFAAGNIKALVTKPSICGFGMNWQICSDMIFCGLSDSYEQFYQAVRRCWRFGQTKPVNVHVIISEREIPVLENIKRKEAAAEHMSKNMVKYTAEILKSEIHKTSRESITYCPEREMILPSWLREGKTA